jgi:hypothetical protein
MNSALSALIVDGFVTVGLLRAVCYNTHLVGLIINCK